MKLLKKDQLKKVGKLDNMQIYQTRKEFTILKKISANLVGIVMVKQIKFVMETLGGKHKLLHIG